MIKTPPGETHTLEPLGRRARKALAVRKALFDAGLAAFERQPIGLVSILDITEAADVAKGVFYLQFKSKDDYLLALWEEVQGRFLDRIRTAAVDRGSIAERAEVAAQQFASFAKDSPAAARFWIRMSSYFPDEVGPPGHLTGIRREYIQQLASIISGKNRDKLVARDVRTSLALDSVCWAVVSAEAHTGEPLFEDRTMAAAVHTVMLYSPKERRNRTGVTRSKST